MQKDTNLWGIFFLVNLADKKIWGIFKTLNFLTPAIKFLICIVQRPTVCEDEI